jgi:hypothetical protein
LTDVRNEEVLGRIGAFGAILGFAIGLVSGYLFLAAAGFDLSAFIEPGRLLEGGPDVPWLLRWGALTDMLGYYLALVPFFVAVGVQLRRRAGALADLVTVGGLMYSTIGALAAAVLAIAGSDLVEIYQTSSGATREAAAIGFRTVTNAVYFASWQTLEIIPLGAWAIGSGLVLWRVRPGLGAVGIVLGAVCLVSSAVTMLDLTSSLGLWLVPLAGSFGLLFWAYALWLGALLIRRAEL